MKNDKHLQTEAEEFARRWEGRGYEKGDSQPFWLELLQTVLGIGRPYDIISFENQVKLSSTSFIDAYIESTHTLIEQKSINRDLRKAIPQSDGSLLTPFQQAKRYAAELPYSKRPRWMVICNFRTFHIYDMENPQGEPEIIELADLGKEFRRLQFLVDTGSIHIQKEMEVSLKAGEIIGEIYDELLKQYVDPESPDTLRSLNILCVRLVFCLYAEDAELFGRHSMFHDYIAQFKPGDGDMRDALIKLFDVLDTPAEKRSPYLKSSLREFPYVNGGLFSDREVEVPLFNEKIAHLILDNASDDFDWSQISPTIFGAIFESTLNPVTRRSGGMHYTSIENIHKVIDPLFLDGLTAELDAIKKDPVRKSRIKKASDYQSKLAGLTFLDPACGSGNFITESYICLRRLENEAIKIQISDTGPSLGTEFTPIMVDIHQFYGIEINDFAVSVATTALWIAESQMMAETEKIMQMDLNFLPLKNYHNIVEGNALRMDWSRLPIDKASDYVYADRLNVIAGMLREPEIYSELNVMAKDVHFGFPERIQNPVHYDYIMGNPPFVGYSFQSKGQKEDILSVFVDENGKPYKTAGKIDYVAGWYFKAAQMMSGTSTQSAFVSTNSISQGEQVAAIWKPLRSRFNVSIDFAWKTFRWDSESSLKAHVHCVIVGFSSGRNHKEHLIYSGRTKTVVDHINPYLYGGDDVFIESHNKPLCRVPEMVTGNRPADGGNLLIEDSDYSDFISKEPGAVKFIRQLIGSSEFINGRKRYCLWLTDISPAELRRMPEVLKRVTACKIDRENAPDSGRRRLASTPHLFRETFRYDTYLVFPATSSENRRYVPIGFEDHTTIPTNSVLIIPDATLYHFGVLTSNVHNGWMRAVCGRLKSDYRYSKEIVYNNFPWPDPTPLQKEKIEHTAEGILQVRARYPDCSLADLYDEVTMPPDLRKAHQDNDRAVMEAYGFNWRTLTESGCVAELLKMYKDLQKSL